MDIETLGILLGAVLPIYPRVVYNPPEDRTI